MLVHHHYYQYLFCIAILIALSTAERVNVLVDISSLINANSLLPSSALSYELGENTIQILSSTDSPSFNFVLDDDVDC